MLNFNPELCRNESEVESKLIVQYLLPKLGYAPDTWHQEVSFGKIRLDFLAFPQKLGYKLDLKSPLGLVLEAKNPQRNLDKHVRQLRQYLTSLNIPYGVLTNGKELRIYAQEIDAVDLVFCCVGKDIDRRFAEIENIIGCQQLQSQLLIPQLKSTPAIITSSPKLSSMKTIAVYHNKGGVGKTTISTNLAAAFSTKGFRVLLIDIDAQANSTFATGLVKFQFDEDDDLRDRNTYHLLESGENNFIDEVSRKSQYFNNPEIDVIPSHITLIDGQEKLTKIAASRSRILSKLKRVENDYDFVIIDTPPSRDIYAEVSLISADYLIIPSDLKPFANQGLPNVIQFIHQVNEYREVIGKQPLQILGVLASKISTNAKFIQYTFPQQREVISKRYNLELMDAVIYERSSLSQCMNNIITTGDLEYPDPKSVIKYADEVSSSAKQSALEFEVLADEVLERIGIK
jgi:chromosome partitioning protein